MAKRRDELIARAANMEAGAKDRTTRAVKEFTVTMGPMKELRNGQGKVYEMVQTMLCRAVVAGRPQPIEAELLIEAGENWGVIGELRECILPAVQEFVELAVKAWMDATKEKAKPLDPNAPLPLPSERGPDPVRSETMKGKNAKMQREKERTAVAEAPVAEDLEGGEGQ